MYNYIYIKKANSYGTIKMFSILLMSFLFLSPILLQATECTSAIATGCGVSITGTTAGDPSTGSGEGTCITSDGTAGTMWYSIIGDGSTWTAETVATAGQYDTKIWVFTGACGALTCVTGNDDGGAGTLSLASFATTVGVTYYIVVGGFSGNTGNYQLDISTAGTCNSECGNAATVTCGTSESGSTVGETTSGMGTCITSAGTGGVAWYTFTGDGNTWTFETVATAGQFDTKLWVFSGSCGSLTCVTGNDDGGVGTLSLVSFVATLGVSYYVIVGGFSANEGNYQLDITNDVSCGGGGCSPSGACGTGSFGQSDYIANVKINTINNASGCTAYTDYTGTTTNVNVGSSYLLTLTVGGGLGFGAYTDCAGWIDWNNDNDFDDANETLTFFDNGTAGPMTSFVTVPSGTALGNKTMRLRTAEGGTTLTACNVTTNGEVEDYTINVNTNIAPSISISLNQGTSGSLCLGMSDTLIAVPVSTPAITSYQWYYGNFSDAEIDNDIVVSQAGTYTVIAENASNEAAMATYVLTVNDLPSGGVTGSYTYCNDSVSVALALSGNGPFSIVIEPGGINYGNVSNGSMVTVIGDTSVPFGIDSVYLTQISDGNGCVSNLGNPVNLVTNGDGTTLAGWTVTANGGNGWLANGAFRTSYGWDRKYQTIDLLAAGYTTTYLDSAPVIYTSEQYSSIFNNGDQYNYVVTLQDASYATIASKSINLTNVGSNSWQLAAFTFDNYGSGVRYIKYEHGGVDTEWWGGHYGTRIDNSIVTIGAKSNTSIGIIENTCSTLPVKLVDFEAICLGKNVSIKWTTASEINNDYFTIERSENGIDYYPLTEIKGSGNNNTIADYNWIDGNPTHEIAYYRLKQTDIDGNFEYFSTAVVKPCSNNLPITVYPNPFIDQLSIVLLDHLKEGVWIEIRDNLGRVVVEEKKNLFNGTCKINIEKIVEKGMYFITIKNKLGHSLHNERLIKR